MIAKKGEHEKLDTEEIRQAMLHGRDLFQNLLQSDKQAEGTLEKETA